MTDGSRMTRRILHTSDLHLASLDDRGCHSLETVVDLASETDADLVIVAGDLFDHNKVDDNLVSFAVEQLQRLPVDVAILPGNHDCLSPDSVYHRAELWKGADNVRILRASDGEMLDLTDLGVLLWGKPIDSYDSNILPLAGIPQPQKNGRWHIAIAHGYFFTSVGAPLFLQVTQDEIISSGWDYIALGHVVTFGSVCGGPVPAYYSGSPSMSGTVAIVDMAEETGVQVTCYSL